MDILELEHFHLEDAVKFHDDLNPVLWDSKSLKPEVRRQLLLIAEDFIQYLGIRLPDIKDITISGSNAAYTYTDHSDIDLHILVDMTKLPDDEVYQELFTAKKTLYNDDHKITIKGIPVELYIQDSNKPVVSIGEYSLMQEKWLKQPTKTKANFNQSLTKAKYEKLGGLIELALKHKNEEQIDRITKLIKRYRQAGLDMHGEFGPENLAYKALRAKGYIKALYNLKQKLHSNKLSIEEVLDTHPTKQHKAKWDFSSPDLEDLKFAASNGAQYQLNFMDPYIGPSEINDYELLPQNLPDSYYDRGKFVEFSQIGKRGKEKQGVEGTGAAAEVFGIVTNGILNYIKKKKPTYLYFQAAESNRQSLYSKIIKKILPLLPNWKLNGPTSDGVYMLYSMPKGMKDVEEDWHPNDTPPGPEFKPTMPKGTIKVDVSDVYDWYKLGQHISNMKGLGKHDFGQGPPSTILSFGDEDLEHKYIDALNKTGLDTTDIDPAYHDKVKGQKVDPRYNVDEVLDPKSASELKWEYKDQPGPYSSAIATAKDKNNNTLKFDFLYVSHFDLTNIEFSRAVGPWGDNYQIDKAGDQYTVFATLIEAIKEYLSFGRPPKFILFSAKEPSRAKLYKSFVNRFAPQFGYKQISSENIPDKVKSALLSKSDVPFFLQYVKSEPVKEADESASGEYLYHATYRPLLKSIQKNGLGGSGAQAKYEDSKLGVTYLAINRDLAVSYAETGDMVPDEWLNEIVVLKIPVDKLDKSKLHIDRNVRDNQGDTLEYHGIIPFSLIKLSESASGYIPSNAEKNDPRFKTALTIDVKPDSIKKNAKAFGFNIKRAGLPPMLKPNGKYRKIK